MASQIVPLPNLVMTTSMTDTSTAGPTGVSRIPAVDISDAIAISGWVNGATTVPGFHLQVAYSRESTATFVPLTQIYPVSTAAGNALGGSTGVVLIYVTSVAFTVPDIAAMQARFASSGAHTTTTATLTWVKRVEV